MKQIPMALLTGIVLASLAGCTSPDKPADTPPVAEVKHAPPTNSAPPAEPKQDAPPPAASASPDKKTETKLKGKQMKTASGLIYEDIVVGNGKEAKNGDNVDVHYEGKLDNGTVFDASRKHGDTPFNFTIGGRVIAGWNEGVPGMKEGGTRILTVPSDLGYGADGSGPIPPNATLTFKVELMKVY